MLRALVRKAASSSGSWSVNSSPCLIATQTQRFQTKHFSVGPLPDAVDRNSDAFAQNSDAMECLLSELQSHIKKVPPFSTKYMPNTPIFILSLKYAVT